MHALQSVAVTPDRYFLVKIYMVNRRLLQSLPHCTNFDAKFIIQ